MPTSTPEASAGPTNAATGRDWAIDATRGVAIWSMIAAHFAGPKSWTGRPTHSYPYVDGMAAFVLLSGLVLGLVYGGWIAKRGWGFTYRRLGKRMVVLYLCQGVICVAAVAAGLAGFWDLIKLRPVNDWWEGLGLSALLRYLPGGGDILLMYLVFMGIAALLLPVLRRGYGWAVLVGSVALYIVAQVLSAHAYSPDWFYIASSPGKEWIAHPNWSDWWTIAFGEHHSKDGKIQNWAGWQIMFFPALVLGWYWRRYRIDEWLIRRLPWLLAAATVGWFALYFSFKAGPWHHIEPKVGDKTNFRWGRVFSSWIVVLTLYAIFGRIVPHLHKRNWLRPFIMTGARSLDSFVIQALLMIVIPIYVVDRPFSAPAATAVVLGVFGICWAWAEFRRALLIDKLHRAPVIIVRRVSALGTGSPAR
ncbi:MAG: OpgC domain-containing protein [Gordonia sp. (in: high G+C Gram-positive bacteria)]|uniref:OpgC domain-containing protein n=1 Tax=Gordonia sp. (in: high G+C Gram-positive bacteria) TaxID=84139 RepID=UPI0039E57006